MTIEEGRSSRVVCLELFVYVVVVGGGGAGGVAPTKSVYCRLMTPESSYLYWYVVHGVLRSTFLDCEYT